ncbi:MAG: hypothetical protein ACLS95_06220 [Clostridia bacterium]
MNAKNTKSKIYYILIAILIVGILGISFLMIMNNKEKNKNLGENQSNAMETLGPGTMGTDAVMTDTTSTPN